MTKAEKREMDMIVKILAGLNTDSLVEIRDVCQRLLQYRAKNVLLLADAKAFSDFMRAKW